jgi:hypothetical protein
MIYTDTCSIENRLRGQQFGEVTITSTFNSKCRVEQNDKSKMTSQGANTGYARLYFLPPGTPVSKGDGIKTTEQRGVTITEAYVEIDEVFRVGRYKPHHVEVVVYNV